MDLRRSSNESSSDPFRRIYEWRKASASRSDSSKIERRRQVKISFRLLFYCFINCVYILIGTVVFMATENGNYQNKSETNKILLNEDLSNFTSRIPRDKLLKIAELQCMLGRTKRWNFHHSLHLTYSIITTIGWGEITTVTPHGKAFAMFYAVLGISLFIMCVASVRQLLLTFIGKIATCLANWLVKKIKTRRRSRQRIKLAITVLLIALLWTANSCYAHSSQAGWTWLMSWYNIFIAVTTIGFGDKVVIDTSEEVKHSADHNPLLDQIQQIALMVSIFAILVLFSTLFEQWKRQNVQIVSKRISSFVNSYSVNMRRGSGSFSNIGGEITGSAAPLGFLVAGTHHRHHTLAGISETSCEHCNRDHDLEGSCISDIASL